MKIVISDYPDRLLRRLNREVAYLHADFPDAEVVIHPYREHPAFLRAMEGASGLLTAFLPLTDSVLTQLPDLRAVSINATGYNCIDLSAAARRGIAVTAIGEYCTQEVAEHTMALLLALDRQLKAHTVQVEQHGLWQYTAVPCPMGLHGRTIGIIGWGRIGQAVSALAQAFGMRVLVYAPNVHVAAAAAQGVSLAPLSEIYAEADVITVHMNLTPENKGFFNRSAFAAMKQHPIFLNAARGGLVNEADLIEALDRGWIRAAGLDVLSTENPKLSAHPLVGRENVILTPHAGFCSERSMEALQRISCSNLTACLSGHPERAFRLVSA